MVNRMNEITIAGMCIPLNESEAEKRLKKLYRKIRTRYLRNYQKNLDKSIRKKSALGVEGVTQRKDAYIAYYMHKGKRIHLWWSKSLIKCIIKRYEYECMLGIEDMCDVKGWLEERGLI